MTAFSSPNTIIIVSHENCLIASVKEMFLRERVPMFLERYTKVSHGNFLQVNPLPYYKDLNNFLLKTAGQLSYPVVSH